MSNVSERQACRLEGMLLKSEFSAELRALIGDRYTYFKNGALYIRFRDEVDRLSYEACQIYNKLMNEIPRNSKLSRQIKELRLGAREIEVIKQVPQLALTGEQ